jgi:hypothetical protein
MQMKIKRHQNSSSSRSSGTGETPKGCEFKAELQNAEEDN